MSTTFRKIAAVLVVMVPGVYSPETEVPRLPNQWPTSNASTRATAAPIAAAINSMFDLWHFPRASLAM